MLLFFNDHMNPDLTRAAEHMERLDQEDADIQMRTDETLCNLDVFGAIAPDAVEEDHKIHVNLFANSETFGLMLRANAENTHVFICQRNPMVAAGIRDRLEAERENAVHSIRYMLLQNGKARGKDTYLRREFALADSTLQSAPFRALPPAIWNILDDRRGTVLRAILNGTQVESASITLPYLQRSQELESPYPFTMEKLPATESRARQGELFMPELHRAYMLAADIVQPGGTLTVAQMTATDDVQHVADTIMDTMHETASAWSAEDGLHIELPEMQYDIAVATFRRLGR